MKNKKFLRLFSVVMAVTVLFSGTLIPGLFTFAGESGYDIWDGKVTAPTQGSGTESDPYLVTNGAELAYAVSDWDAFHYKLTNDIYLNDVSNEKWYEGSGLNVWESDKWNDYEFIGTLNGDGHVIYGLYINDNSAVYKGYGLICKMSLDSTIKNLGIEKAYINAPSGIVGAIVGERSWISSKNAYITNCYVGEDVILNGGTVGGIIAYNSNSRLVISNCYSLAQVSGTDYVGGITGDQRSKVITLSNCYSNSVIAGKDAEHQERTNCFEATATFAKENMQGKDVFTNPEKMPALNSSGAYIATEGYPILRAFTVSTLKNYKITELDGKYKTQGRTALVDDALMLDWSASGIEFNADCIGDIEITVKADVKNTTKKGGLYFTVVVDDKVMYEDLRIPGNNNADNWTSNSTNYPFYIPSSGEYIFRIAEGLDAGRHNIKIYKQTEAQDGSFGITKIALDGELTDAPEVNDMYIEVVGDSIVAGLGNIAVGGEGAPLYQDALRGWPYLTAKALEADLSVVAQSGITATNGMGWTDDAVSMQTVYPLQRYYSDKNTKYGFDRNPDVILVSLGTNDYWLLDYYKDKDFDDIKDSIKAMLTLLREKNPDSKIVWLYGMMTTAINDLVVNAVTEMGGEAKGYYTLSLPTKTGGGQGHPELEAQKIYADSVAEYIQIILGLKDPSKNIWDGKVTAPASGSGTEADPYLIANGSELAYAVNDESGSYYKITSDIYLNDVEKTNWYEGKMLNEWNGGLFYGHINGDGHVIYGMYIKENLNDGNAYGLITKMHLESTIRNLGIESSYIDVPGGFVGGFVGERSWILGEDAIFECCYVGANVILKGGTVGGIISYNSNKNLVIKNCYSLAQVSGTDCMGGIIGDSFSRPVTILNSYTNSVMSGNGADKQLKHNTYELSLDFTSDKMQGKDVFSNLSKMPYLNTELQFRSTENYPVLRIFTDNPEFVDPNDIPTVEDEGITSEGVKGRVWSGKLATKFAGGTGTEEDPYTIETPEQMAFFVSGMLDLNPEYDGKYFKLTADLKLNDTSKKDWQKTAKNWFAGEYHFNGHFDGDGHVVSGLYYNGTGDMIALIPYMTPGSTLKNVGVTESTIIAKEDTVPTYPAALVSGITRHWTISKEEAEQRGQVVISNCFADSTVYIEGTAAGGIACYGALPAKIDNCFFTGTLKYNKSSSHAGGIIGNTFSTSNEVTNCYTATADRDTAIGNVGKNTTAKNLYVDGPLNQVQDAQVLNPKAMFGKNAIKWMEGFDFENVWMTVEEGTPVLRIFGSEKYSCKREPQKVSIEFLALGGSKCDTIYGYPRFTEITKLPTPTRYGYRFDGWYFYEEYDIPFNLETFPDYNIWLYPKWVETGFTKDFEKNTINTKYDINGSVRHFRPGAKGYNMDYIYGGMKSLHCLGDTKYNPTFLLSYENTLTVGNVYEMKFWLTTDMESASGEIKLVHTNYPDVHDEIYAYETGTQFNGLKNGEWKQYTVRFTAGTPYVLIQTPSNTSIYFDDIQVIDTGLKGEFKGTLATGKLDNGADEPDDNTSDNDNTDSKTNVKNEKESSNIAIIIVICAGAVVLLLAVAVVIIIVLKRRKKA